MRILSFIGLGLGGIAIFLALYLHFEIAPLAEYAEELDVKVKPADYLGSPEEKGDLLLFQLYVGQRTFFGQLSLLLGGMAFLVSIFPAIKRNKFAIIGASLGLISFFIGAAYGTHMFS
ncbi:hypothetical protein N8Z79_02845 [Crocinitomicaceae bacterium]|nr:hypothetical protein [Crocinitomicaceae bacterium]MDC1361696.1 hypothetical protein [Crocinitomicaceae bacterium]